MLALSLQCADEAMFRMDAKLASYFATLKEGRGGSARTARDELINFKMRVAGLVEAFCKRVGASEVSCTAALHPREQSAQPRVCKPQGQTVQRCPRRSSFCRCPPARCCPWPHRRCWQGW